MARIVVLSMAYRGDVHPYAPVASELASRGHEVTFVVPREFHDEFASQPFTCEHSGSDFSPIELDKHGDWLATWGMRFGGARLLELYLGKFTVPHLPAQYAAVHDALDGADVLFTHSTAAIVGAMAAEAHGLPWISGDLFPMLIPTATASPIPTIPSMGPRANSLLWKLARQTRPDRLSFAGDFADFRRSKGLDARRRSMIDLRISPHLNLGMASPNYIDVAPDWPDNYRLTGFTHWNNDAGHMPDGLEEFLDAGAPALLITLGTLAAASHPERFAAAVHAADALGLRTVSLCSRQDTADNLTRTIESLGSSTGATRHVAYRFAPLSKVLHRVCAVIHSGSHGTNSMTLTAGLPSVAVPSIFDQVWHAKRQEQLGTGIHAKNGAGLADALQRLLQDPGYATRAADLGTKLRAEDGTTETANQIESFLATT